MKIIGIVLIVVGIVGLAYGGLSWTQRETVLDMGPVEVAREDRESLPVPPLAGAISLVAGVALVLAGGRRAA